MIGTKIERNTSISRRCDRPTTMSANGSRASLQPVRDVDADGGLPGDAVMRRAQLGLDRRREVADVLHEVLVVSRSSGALSGSTVMIAVSHGRVRHGRWPTYGDVGELLELGAIAVEVVHDVGRSG